MTHRRRPHTRIKRKVPIRLDPSLHADRRRLCETLILAKAEAGRVGLWKTMHALNTATDAIGWEVADIEAAISRPPSKAQK